MLNKTISIDRFFKYDFLMSVHLTRERMGVLFTRVCPICSGGLPLTSLESIQVELGEVPLDLRRSMLTDTFRKKKLNAFKPPYFALCST